MYNSCISRIFCRLVYIPAKEECLLKPNRAFKETLPFCFTRLMIGLAVLLICGILLLIFLTIGLLVGEDALLILYLSWIACAVILFRLIQHYLIYLFQIGQHTALAELYADMRLPANPVGYSIEQVQNRFHTAAEYYRLRESIHSALLAITNAHIRAGRLMPESITGFSAILYKAFYHSYLKLIENGCLGYVTLHTEVDIGQGASESVAVFYAAWRRLMKNAIRMIVMTMGFCVLVFLLLMLIYIPLFSLINSSFPFWTGLFFSLFTTAILKESFWDSWLTSMVMHQYIGISYKIPFTYELLNRMGRVSPACRSLVNQLKQ